MPGFFDESKVQIDSLSKKGKAYSCASCGLYKDALTYKIPPYGNFKKLILNIGEAPGDVEDHRGKPWQGKVGRVLQYTYRQLGIDLFDDCLNINSVNCHPPNNKTPTPHQIACCRNIVVDDVIKQNKPAVIVVLGGAALQSLIGHRWKKDMGGITKWRGWTIPDQDLKTWIVPTYHPSFIVRSEEHAETIWRQDLQLAIDMLSVDFPLYKKPDIEFITDLSILERLQTDLVSIDFETTGLKPYYGGHRIISASVSPSPDKAYVFMIPSTKEELQPFLNLLSNPGIGKMAHNMKFEEIWSREVFGIPIKGWVWDSMLAAHIFDNRYGVSGLKFQTYTQLGIVDFASEIEPHIKNTDGGGNDFNKILEFIKTTQGREKLMTYNGYDTINEYRLAKLQMAKIPHYDFLPII